MWFETFIPQIHKMEGWNFFKWLWFCPLVQKAKVGNTESEWRTPVLLLKVIRSESWFVKIYKSMPSLIHEEGFFVVNHIKESLEHKKFSKEKIKITIYLMAQKLKCWPKTFGYTWKISFTKVSTHSREKVTPEGHKFPFFSW